jgi:hypothetical protein
LHEGADVTRRLAARQQRVGEQFAQLYKSLGGGWQNYQTLPGDPAATTGYHCRVSPRVE